MKNKYSFFTRLQFATAICLLAGILSAQNAFIGKPRYQIEAKRLGNSLGIVNIELFPNIAPYHVQNFDSLVSKKFYDTTAFHRVIPGFMIQGGDPNSRHGAINTWGFGQPGQPTVKAEFSAAKHERGILSAARSSNINSATSQFFICVAAASHLNGQYSVYGRVTSGMSVVDTIVKAPRNMSTNNPLQKIEMFITYIGYNDTVPNPPSLISPVTNSVNCDTNVLNLKWSKVSDGQIYRLHISTDSLFSDTIKQVFTGNQSANIQFLPSGTKFYWKVTVNNGGFNTDSQYWNFTTQFPPGVATGVDKGGSPSVVRVFPNPGHDKFNFSNLAKGDVIRITDVQGKLVHELIATAETVTVDLGNLSKGTYLYKISAATIEKQQGKLILQ